MRGDQMQSRRRFIFIRQNPALGQPQRRAFARPTVAETSTAGEQDLREGEPQWYAATIVAYRPNARIYFFTLHFDADGIEIFVGLPDDTVELLTATS